MVIVISSTTLVTIVSKYCHDFIHFNICDFVASDEHCLGVVLERCRYSLMDDMVIENGVVAVIAR